MVLTVKWQEKHLLHKLLQICAGVSVEKSILQMQSTIFTLLVKDIEQLHIEKEKNWFKLKYNSQEMSRQEITKAFSLLLTTHPRHGSIPRQHTLLCLKNKMKTFHS